jgi:alpha-L-rhamnosidase
MTLGRTFAGVVDLVVDGHDGQTITVRHAEILKPDGTLNTDFLRTAKATLTYVCREGRQEFSPRLTYMGFRYVAVSGASEGDIKICAHALYSDLRTTGEFSCSDERPQPPAAKHRVELKV